MLYWFGCFDFSFVPVALLCLPSEMSLAAAPGLLLQLLLVLHYAVDLSAIQALLS
jgi:hypothetical protein